MLTDSEKKQLATIKRRLEQTLEYLGSHHLSDQYDLPTWFDVLNGLRQVQGNPNNDISFVACLLAKIWLSKSFDTGNFDVAAKAQGASGLDIDFVSHGRRIVGEVKSTVPYIGAKGDLGAQQKTTFKKDFEKLNKAMANQKFFFVTDRATYDIVLKKYSRLIPEVEVVLL